MSHDALPKTNSQQADSLGSKKTRIVLRNRFGIIQFCAKFRNDQEQDVLKLVGVAAGSNVIPFCKVIFL